MEIPDEMFPKMKLDIPCEDCDMTPEKDAARGYSYCEKCAGLGLRFRCIVCNEQFENCECEWRIK